MLKQFVACNSSHLLASNSLVQLDQHGLPPDLLLPLLGDGVQLVPLLLEGLLLLLLFLLIFVRLGGEFVC